MSVRTRRRHSAPSEVPRRVRTATGPPAALFLRRHGVSDISDGMVDEAELDRPAGARLVMEEAEERSIITIVGSESEMGRLTLVCACIAAADRGFILNLAPAGTPRRVLVLPSRHVAGAGVWLADACARVDQCPGTLASPGHPRQRATFCMYYLECLTTCHPTRTLPEAGELMLLVRCSSVHVFPVCACPKPWSLSCNMLLIIYIPSNKYANK